MQVKRVLLVLVLCVSIFVGRSQTAGYTARWQVVDSLIGKKGLTQSALDEVNKIYALARQEKNEPQVIRALVYRLHLEGIKTENGIPVTILALQKEIDGSLQPERSILQNILAGVYLGYLQQNRWRLNDRTNTQPSVGADIATWSLDDLNKKIRELYLASLKDEDRLARISLNAYEPIIIPGNTRRLRPTLFDLLAHNALDYFRVGDAYSGRYSIPFETDDISVFDDAGEWATRRFRTDDTLAPRYEALLLYQRLIRRHLGDTGADAMVEVDIERVGFAESVFAGDNKKDFYLRALGRIAGRHEGSPAADQALYLQAQQHASDATEGEDSTGNVKARSICEQVVAKKDSSEGWANCRNLLHDILREQLTLQTESVNIPDRPMRVLVTWRNCTRLYLRIIRMDAAMRTPFLSLYDSTYLDRLLKMPVVRSVVQQLPETGDYLEHRVEIGLASLPPGDYVLAASTDSGFSSHQGVIAAGEYAVSNIAYMSLGDDFFVLNRETGRPLAGAEVTVWYRAANSGKWSDREKGETYTTDGDGHFLMKKKATRTMGVRYLEIRIPGDHLFPMQTGFTYYGADAPPQQPDKEKYEKDNRQCALFTDRSIYRPGQTVFFKGILTTKDFDTHRVRLLAGDSCKVILFDANEEAIDSLVMVTNAFGSYHGSFRLPQGQLNGTFKIADGGEDGDREFSVEEYKRPKFYVDYEKQKGNYRLGDSIRVTGAAKAYAGNDIDGGKVVWRVVRSGHFRRIWQLGGTSPMPYSAEQEVAHGQTTTNANGKFTVVFAALPDRQIKRSLDPEFEYTVSADVTDISGETRSGALTIVAGYTAINLSLSIPGGDRLSVNSFHTVQVNAGNLSGEPVGAKVHVWLTPLKAPQRLIRNRLWEAPDRYVWNEKEWLDSFPNDEYRDETAKESWERGARIWDTTAAIAGDGPMAGRVALEIPAGKIAPGWYLIEVRSTDSLGQEVKDMVYEEVYDGAIGRPGNPQYRWPLGDGVTAQPGGTATTASGSSADVYVIRTLQRQADDTPGVFSHFTMNGQKKSTGWKITEADRGGFGVLDAWVRDNRIYTHFSLVQVPWTNKELDIHYSTFRDKTEPGSAEKWEMQISGSRGEKVSAEVLTAMYDASLDQFREHGWSVPELYPVFSGGEDWNAWKNFSADATQAREFDHYQWVYIAKSYDQLLKPDDVGHVRRLMVEGRRYRLVEDKMALPTVQLRSDGLISSGDMYAKAQPVRAEAGSAKFESADSTRMAFGREGPVAAAAVGLPVVQARKDFRETAFFLPDLRTDSAGDVRFSFTMPEAVTSWKWMTLAHTRDLAFGYGERTVITQKELMVQPNAPRFLREGDRMELPVKVVNLTDSELTGQMSLQLTDPTTGQSADGWFINRQANQYFTVGARQSIVVGFPIEIPYQYNRPLTYTVVAQAGNYSDGEEATLPVVSNRLLVTESLPLNMPGNGEQHFTFDKLLKSGSSETLNNHALTVEFTTNPAWYAVQSLPYLMEYPHECSEQLFERVYANALASHITGSTPRLRQVFDRWRTADTTALLGNLQKDQELKTVLLEETPWVFQGKSEAQQRKNIALLFDMGRMSRELGSALDRLQNMQSSSGAFPWWSGGPDSRYITQYIVTGIGHLQRLRAIPAALSGPIDTIVGRALAYLDAEVIKDYQRAKAVDARGGSGGGAGRTNGQQGSGAVEPIRPLAVQYLYMRSLFPNRGLPGDVFPAVNYFRKKAQGGWLQCNRYEQGMIALALYRTGDIQTARDIIASLKQNAIRDPGQGMYWKGMEGGYYWYQAPVETQSLLIEAFREITGDAGIDNDLKTWLLKQKQTHEWSTTTATADACYALLAGGQDWLNAGRAVQVKLGEKTIDWPAGSGEAGIGYNKKVFDGAFVNPSMGEISVKMQGGGSGPAWGAVYWQYFDMLDRITPPGGNKTALSVSKKLFIRRDTDRGPVLEALSDNATLKPGDRVVARIELRADRDLEYVHMKDMRAACLEPVNVISQYKWQGGLGYYESTKDASTDFFFDVVPRGTYVFEYDMLAGQSGNFSNGITTVECLYAPEFSYHSEGIRVNVEPAN